MPACNSHHSHIHNNESNMEPRHGEEGDGEGEDKKSTTAEVLDLFLPRSVIPLQYDLKFIPFLDEGNFTYNGVAKIRVNVTENCRNVTLHARVLKIDPETLNIWHVREKRNVGLEKQYIVEAKQFYVIEVEEELQAGELYEVNINFKGMLNDDLEGFYKSKYEVGNETR